MILLNGIGRLERKYIVICNAGTRAASIVYIISFNFLL
jgi:hypothetical protein